jgi:hypothetical protein
MATPSWDLADQDCDAFDADFNKVADGDGDIYLDTYDSRSVYRCYTGGTGLPYVSKTNLPNWTECTAEIVFRFESTNLAYPISQFYLRDQNSWEYTVYFYKYTGYGNVPYIAAYVIGATYAYLSMWADATASEWHTVRIVVASGVMHVWFDGQYNGPLTHVGTARPSYTPNTIGVSMNYTNNTGARNFYVDHIRMSSTKAEPDYHNLITIQGIQVNTRIIRGNPAGDCLCWRRTTGPAGALNYTLPVVATTDSLASAARIQLSSGEKAIQKMPTF